MRCFAIRISLSILPWCCLFLAACDSPTVAPGDRSEVSTTQDSIWQAVQSSTSDKQAGSGEWWNEITEQCETAFAEMLRHPDNREQMEEYVAQFGKHGPWADFKWALAYPLILLPDIGGTPPVSASKYPEVRELQLLASDLQVRHFLKHPELFARYYHFAAWSDGLVGRTSAPVFYLESTADATKRGLSTDHNPNAEGEFGFWARNAMLLMHATNRDDLIQDLDVKEVPRVFSDWYAWFYPNKDNFHFHEKEPKWYLAEEAEPPPAKRRFAKPQVPLPDWEKTGIEPLPPIVFELTILNHK